MKRNKQLELRSDDCLMLLNLAFKNIIIEPDKLLKSLGLNRSHHRILFYARKKRGITVSELLRVLDVSRQALHRPLKNLIDKEFVQMEPVETDRRNFHVVLTKSGQDLEYQLTESQRQMFNDIQSRLGEKNTEAWVQLMKQLAGSNVTIFNELSEATK